MQNADGLFFSKPKTSARIMELSREWYSEESPVSLSDYEKENMHKMFNKTEAQKPMVITPSKSPLLDAWHSSGKQHDKLRKGPVRISTPTKVKQMSSPRVNKSPLHVPYAMETSSLGKKLNLIGTDAAPRFATPTRASRMAAEFLATKKEESNNINIVNMISPSPTKTSSNKKKNFSMSSPSAPPRKMKNGTPTRKSTQKQSETESASIATPTKSRNSQHKSSVNSGLAPSFMKSTASSRSNGRPHSRNNSYVELASSSSKAEAVLYANSPANKKFNKQVINNTPKATHNKNMSGMYESSTNASPVLSQNGPAIITPSPEQQPSSSLQGKEQDGEKLSFDIEDLLTTMNMATKSLNKSLKGVELKHMTPSSSCAATVGNNSSGSDKSLNCDEGLSQVGPSNTKISASSPIAQPSPLRKKTSHQNSPARKPWRPSSTTPKRMDIFNSTSTTSATNTPKKKSTHKDLFGSIPCDDGSLSPISRKSTQLLNGNNRTPIKSPAPFKVKATPYTASPLPNKKQSLMDVTSLPKPPSTSSTFVVKGDDGDLNSDVKTLSDFTALPPRSPIMDQQDNQSSSQDDQFDNFDMNATFHETNPQTTTIKTPTSFQSSSSSSPFRGNRSDNISLSLGEFPSPQKTAHGFPIQAKPRFQIMNPVMFALENDKSRDMDDMPPSSFMNTSHTLRPFMDEEENDISSIKLTEDVESQEKDGKEKEDNDDVKVLGGAFRALSANKEDYKVLTPPPSVLQPNTSSTSFNSTHKNIIREPTPMTSSTPPSPFRYISGDPLATKALGNLIKPVATPSPQTSPRESS